MGWLVFMGFLYISGAMLYAFRIPERWAAVMADIGVELSPIYILGSKVLFNIGDSPAQVLPREGGHMVPLPPGELEHLH